MFKQCCFPRALGGNLAFPQLLFPFEDYRTFDQQEAEDNKVQPHELEMVQRPLFRPFSLVHLSVNSGLIPKACP